MNDKQLKAKIEALLDTPVITTAIIDQLHALVLDPKKAKSATKQASTSNDKQIVADLRKQVADLKNQLQPKQTTAIIDQEKLLEDLFQLQLKRQQEIIQKGLDVTIGLSETPFKCLKKSDEAVYFLAGTNVAASQQIKSNGGLIGIITSVSQESGRLLCKLFCPSHTSQVYQKTTTATGQNLKPSGISEPCKISGNTITFYSKQFQAGTILNVSGSYFEVLGTRTDGNLVTHSVKAYEMKQQAVAGARTHYVDSSDMPRNVSLYHSQVM